MQSEAEDRVPLMSLEDRLLGVICEISAQLRGVAVNEVTADLDSGLTDELGIDSLTRMEIVRRLERELRLSVPDRIAATAVTPRDLLLELKSLDPIRESARAAGAPARETDGRTPAHLGSLVEVFEWQAARHGDRPHITILDDAGERQTLSFEGLARSARLFAAALRSYGVEPGETVGIMLPTSPEFFESFLGVMYAGAVPVPLYPPHRLDQIQEILIRQMSILNSAAARLLIAPHEARRFESVVKSGVPSLRSLLTADELGRGSDRVDPPIPGGDSIAFIQYTSGSTGTPKGVTLTHSSILANVRAMGSVVGVTENDRFVSWLPLYHDMGLIGGWFGSLYYGATLIAMSPFSFIARPERWLWTIHRERGTLSAAPNFAYELCASKVPAEAFEGLDLSSWRTALNGAEPVSADTLERFLNRFEPLGFRREHLMPVYGLAETCVGLTFPPIGRGPLIDYIDRTALQSEGRALPAAPGKAQTRPIVSCGRALPGHTVRVVDTSLEECPERVEGRVQFQGPSSTKGYFRNPEATKGLFAGSWIETGDLGYMADGELFVTGRSKDLIIRGGRNLHPEDIELLVNKVNGVRKGAVAAFAARDTATETERLVIAVETRETSPQITRDLIQAIRQQMTSYIGLPPDEVRLLPPGTLPKTPSGKIRRSRSRELFERGELGVRKSVWRQLVSVRVGTAAATVRRSLATAFKYGYAFSVYLAGFCLLVPLSAALALLPTVRMRRSATRRAAKLFFVCSGMPVGIRGAGTLPAERPLVVVANHASYLDAVLLTAVLPPEFAFVAKRELKTVPILGWALNRLGTIFVERFDAGQSVEDSGTISARVRAGDSVVLFPEGTFQWTDRLLPFKMGAFLLAAEEALPVVPVVLNGTRRALRAESWLLRRTELRVLFLNPERAADTSWESAARMKDRVFRLVEQGLSQPGFSNEEE